MSDQTDNSSGTTVLRRCKGCGNDVALAPGSWVYSKGKPQGAYCRRCATIRAKQRKQRYRQAAATGEANLFGSIPASGSPHPAVQGREQKAAERAGTQVLLKPKQLDAALALRAGAAALNDNAVDILTRAATYASDPTSPHHEWAMKMFLSRILPEKLFAGLGQKAAGIDPRGKPRGRDQLPVSIIISAPGMNTRLGRTLEAEDANDQPKAAQPDGPVFDAQGASESAREMPADEGGEGDAEG